jgi:UrcA family protein
MTTQIHGSLLSKRLTAACGIALLAAAMFTGPASAKSLDEITVQGYRLTTRQVGRSYTGIPIDEISLSVRVNTAGLNLATPEGLSDVQKRIHAASLAACAQISRLYPLAEPRDKSCAATAERAALEQVGELALGLPTRVRVLEFTLPAAAS